MSLPNLCLAPHEAGELAHDELLCAPAIHRVRVWNALYGGTYLLRQVELSVGGSEYVARSQSSPSAPLLRFRWQHDSVPHIVTALREGKMGRMIYFDAGGQLASSNTWHLKLFIDSDGKSYWEDVDGIRSSRAEFKRDNLHIARQLSSRWRARTSDTQVQSDISRMLAEDESDCAFAWRWMHLGDRERLDLLCRLSRGDLKECENFARMALHSDPPWEEYLTRTWNIDFHVEPSPALATVIASNIDVGNPQHPVKRIDLSPRQIRLLEILVRHIGLSRRAEVECRTVARNQWVHPYYEKRYYWPISVSFPTEHERLEARLQLRDWLRDKVAPDELAALLSEP